MNLRLLSPVSFRKLLISFMIFKKLWNNPVLVDMPYILYFVVENDITMIFTEKELNTEEENRCKKEIQTFASRYIGY